MTQDSHFVDAVSMKTKSESHFQSYRCSSDIWLWTACLRHSNLYKAINHTDVRNRVCSAGSLCTCVHLATQKCVDLCKTRPLEQQRLEQAHYRKTMMTLKHSNGLSANSQCTDPDTKKHKYPVSHRFPPSHMLTYTSTHPVCVNTVCLISTALYP